MIGSIVLHEEVDSSVFLIGEIGVGLEEAPRYIAFGHFTTALVPVCWVRGLVGSRLGDLEAVP
jgi:hypothetical protein